MSVSSNYTEDNIRSLDWKEHIRMRPGMYIGKLGDGSSPDDGIYILLKEVLDNSIDEFVMGAGKTIEISISDSGVSVRDYGRGIPLGKVVDVVSKMNTGGKYDSRAFKKSVGLNGVGTKAVNALSSSFKVDSCRDGKIKSVYFEQGNLTLDKDIEESSKRKGTKVTFIPDDLIFKKSRKVGFLSANRRQLRNHENIYVFKEEQGAYNPQKTEGKPTEPARQGT